VSQVSCIVGRGEFLSDELIDREDRFNGRLADESALCRTEDGLSLASALSCVTLSLRARLLDFDLFRQFSSALWAADSVWFLNSRSDGSLYLHSLPDLLHLVHFGLASSHFCSNVSCQH
jgi:hypothetical protein